MRKKGEKKNKSKRKPYQPFFELTNIAKRLSNIVHFKSCIYLYIQVCIRILGILTAIFVQSSVERMITNIGARIKACGFATNSLDVENSDREIAWQKLVKCIINYTKCLYIVSCTYLIYVAFSGKKTDSYSLQQCTKIAVSLPHLSFRFKIRRGVAEDLLATVLLLHP